MSLTLGSQHSLGCDFEGSNSVKRRSSWWSTHDYLVWGVQLIIHCLSREMMVHVLLRHVRDFLQVLHVDRVDLLHSRHYFTISSPQHLTMKTE
jgi:hypothetical protein